MTSTSNSPEVVIVVAASENAVIGRKGQLPWHLPDDLKWFKAQTKGNPVIMGRKTMEALGKPLPGRVNIVISRSLKLANAPPGFILSPSLNEALSLAQASATQGRICIIGGGQIYAQALAISDRVLLTRVYCQVEDGDAFFALPPAGFTLTQVLEVHEADDRHVYKFQFEDWEKVIGLIA